MGNAAAATTTTISLDRFRRRRASAAAAAAATSEQAPGAGIPGEHPLVGAVLGMVERHYGLMSSEQAVLVSEVISASGDLAVADRLAFIAAMERHVPIVVVEHDGWFLACATDHLLDPATLAELRPASGDHAAASGSASPRIMSIVTDRGITPALGPLCA